MSTIVSKLSNLGGSYKIVDRDNDFASPLIDVSRVNFCDARSNFDASYVNNPPSYTSRYVKIVSDNWEVLCCLEEEVMLISVSMRQIGSIESVGFIVDALVS